MRIAVSALGLFVSSLAFGGALVRQLPGANPEEGYFAAATANQLFQTRAADDFTIAGGPITAIAWWGRNSSSTVQDLSNFSGMDIVIWGNSVTKPDTSQIYFHKAVTLAQLSILQTGAVGNSGNRQYRFELAIDSLALGPGTYWLSIASKLKYPLTDTLLWNSSPDGNAKMATFAYPLNSWFPLGTDLAFEIIPSPGGTALAAFAIPLYFHRRRSRRTATRLI